jgi:hypothetical protein
MTSGMTAVPMTAANQAGLKFFAISVNFITGKPPNYRLGSVSLGKQPLS